MKSLLAWYGWRGRNIWNTLAKKVMSFLLLSFLNVVLVGIYVFERKAIIDALRAADNALVAPFLAVLENGFAWTVMLYVLIIFLSLLQIAHMRCLMPEIGGYDS